MALRQPMLAFLRPLPAPRPTTVSYFLRRLESTQAQAAAPTRSFSEDPNLVASRIAPATYPPNTIKSLPRPKESKASHRTSQPTKARIYPDRLPPPTPVEFLPETESAPNLPFYVTRTKSHQMPIYLERKRGGNLRQTRLKKISGSSQALRDALESELGVKERDCVVNGVTGHVVIKGWHKPQIEAFLKARRF